MQLRELITQILRSNDQPLGAYDIARQVSRITGKKCHANSIYRILNPMVRAGEVQSIATTHSFALVEHGTSPLLWCICQKCRACRYVDAKMIHQSLDNAARTNGFVPTHQHVELIGLCPDCRKFGRG